MYIMIIFPINMNTNVDVDLNTDISAKTNNSSIITGFKYGQHIRYIMHQVPYAILSFSFPSNSVGRHCNLCLIHDTTKDHRS